MSLSKKLQENLEFFNISTDEFTIFEWKPPRSYKSYMLDLNILKQNPVNDIFFHMDKGNLKIVHIRKDKLIYSAGANIELQFQLLEAFIVHVSELFHDTYAVDTILSYGNFDSSVFSGFKTHIEDSITGFDSLNLVKEIKVQCKVCNSILPLSVRRKLIEESESHPVPIVYNHKGHALLCFIDKNFSVRGEELVNITG